MKINPEKYYIIRTYSAGVWFGKLKEVDGTKVIVTEARRLWKWSGAASLSQMAIEGVKDANGCKFAMTITDPDGIYLPQAVEILPCTESAANNIKEVKEWKM